MDNKEKPPDDTPPSSSKDSPPNSASGKGSKDCLFHPENIFNDKHPTREPENEDVDPLDEKHPQHHDQLQLEGPSLRRAISTAPTVKEALASKGGGTNGPDNGDEENEAFEPLERNDTQAREIWKFKLRAANDDDPQDWWFASTAIPLLAATTGPLANVMSIAALVTSWRMDYDPANPGIDDLAIGYADPRWCIGLNIASLVCGFAGNIFLLFNFTRRIRYIVALPATIVLWYFATVILISITACIHIYEPPIWPGQLYSQGFWHAVIAAVLYLLSSMLLMINMLGYFLGHYPQHFELSEEQRNLILQTMMFFLWLAGGGAVFSKVCGWAYVDALYFCDVTVLTVGFGDFFPADDVGRGLVFPFSVGGIIILGLMVSSIRKFAQELGHDKVVKGHVESRRMRTIERAVTSSFEAEQRTLHALNMRKHGSRPSISAPFNPEKRTIAFAPPPDIEKGIDRSDLPMSPMSIRSFHMGSPLRSPLSPMSWISNMSSASSFRSTAKSPTSPRHQSKFSKRASSRQPKLLILREEKDRFDAMRQIQYSTRRFKRYFALCMSVLAFGLLWCVGAVFFMVAESHTQDLSYFEALYFCYVSLLTIGYGDLSPKSNAGKPFFIVWSLVAVPTMTILISDMSDTIILSYKRGTFSIADWTVLPKYGIFRDFLDRHPRLEGWLDWKLEKRKEAKRLKQGFPVGPDDSHPAANSHLPPMSLEQLASEEDAEMDEHDLARRLAMAIRKTADDLKQGISRHYTYEEWVEYTRLIRFSRYTGDQAATLGLEGEEESHGLIEWDWIGEDSPMMADGTETEWVLDRLCESLDRYMSKQVPEHVKQRRRSRVSERAVLGAHLGPQDSFSSSRSRKDSLTLQVMEARGRGRGRGRGRQWSGEPAGGSSGLSVDAGLGPSNRTASATSRSGYRHDSYEGIGEEEEIRNEVRRYDVGQNKPEAKASKRRQFGGGGGRRKNQMASVGGMRMGF